MTEQYDGFEFDPNIGQDESEEQNELEDITPTYDETGETFEETETSLDVFLQSSKSYLDRANTNAEVDKFYDSFPEYELDQTIRIRNKTKFSLDPEKKRLKIRHGDRFVYLSSEIHPYIFFELSTMASKYGKGGANFIRDVLGFEDYTSGGAKKNHRTCRIRNNKYE